MMKELLKPMTGSDALLGDEEGSEGSWGSNGALGEFASEALGQALSQHGGFGMADKIVRDLSRSETGKNPGPVTGNPAQQYRNQSLSITKVISTRVDTPSKEQNAWIFAPVLMD